MLKIVALLMSIYLIIAMIVLALYLTGELELDINSRTRGKITVSKAKYYCLCFLMSIGWIYTIYLLYKGEQDN